MLPFVKIESSTLSVPSAPRTMPPQISSSSPAVPSLSSVTPHSAPARPAKAIARTYPAVPLKDNDDIQLERGASTIAFDASDLERSRPVTPVEMEDADDEEQEEVDETVGNGPGIDHGNGSDRRLSHQSSLSGGLGTDDEDNGVEVLKSMWHPYKNRFRMASVAIVTLTDGLHDSAAGALLPYIERHYGIGYGVVSLIFVATAFGSIAAATVVDPLKRRLGRARTLCAAELLMALGYLPMLTMAAPFPAVVMGFFVVGLGEAINVAMGNTFCMGLQQSTVALGIMHGSYGLGGISGPLIATALAVASGAAADPDNRSAAAFARYYFVPFGLCVLSAVLCAWSFTGYERDWGEGEQEDEPSSSSPSSDDPTERRRRWQLGRQLQEQQQHELQLQQQQVPRQDKKQQPTTFRDIPLRQLQPASQPPLQLPSPTHEPLAPISFAPSRPTASPLQSPLQSAAATPTQSFTSSEPLFMSPPSAPLTHPQATAPAATRTPSPPFRRPRRRRNHQQQHSQRNRSRAQRATDRLHDVFTAPAARVVLLGALFLFLYQGAEVSIPGWVTSFLMADRQGKEPAVGYVTSGFWGGITLGRFALAVVPVQQRAGPGRERLFVCACVAGAAACELLVWLVPAVVGDGVAVAVVGLLLGPIYPCAAGLLMRGLSRREQVAGMGVMTAFGSAGGAAAPFVTGVLAQVVGPFVLHPVVLALCAAMLAVWWLVPVARKPTE